MTGDLADTINNIRQAQGQPQMNPLLANTILGQGMAASNAVQKSNADEKAARPTPEITLGQDPSTGEPFIKRATNLPIMNKPAEAADAAAKPMEDAYAALGRGGFLNITPAGDTSTPATRGTAFATPPTAAPPDQYATLAQHGYAVPQASNAAADTSSFGGAYRASRDLGNKPGRAAFDALLQSRGRGDTQGFVNKVANQRTAMAEKLAAPIEAQDRADARLFDSLTNPVNLQQYSSADQAKKLIGGQVTLTPERSQFIDSAFANLAGEGQAKVAKDRAASINSLIKQTTGEAGMKTLSTYKPNEFDRYVQDWTPEGTTLSKFDVGRLKAAFTGTQNAIVEQQAKYDAWQQKQANASAEKPVYLPLSVAKGMSEDDLLAMRGDPTARQPSVEMGIRAAAADRVAKMGAVQTTYDKTIAEHNSLVREHDQITKRVTTIGTRVDALNATLSGGKYDPQATKDLNRAETEQQRLTDRQLSIEKRANELHATELDLSATHNDLAQRFGKLRGDPTGTGYVSATAPAPQPAAPAPKKKVLSKAEALSRL
jgi:hypothetical protein